MYSLIHILEAVGIFFLWNRIDHSAWWALTIVLVLMYFVSKTYKTAIRDGSEERVVRFWINAGFAVLVLDVLAVLSIYSYILFIK